MAYVTYEQHELEELRQAVLKKASVLGAYKGNINKVKSGNNGIIRNIEQVILDETSERIESQTLYVFFRAQGKKRYNTDTIDILILFSDYKGILPGYKSRAVRAQEHYLQGLKMQKENLLLKATEQYKLCYTLQPHNNEYMLKYAQLLMEYGDIDFADVLLQKIRESVKRASELKTEFYYNTLLAYALVTYKKELPKEANVICCEAIALATELWGSFSPRLIAAYNLAAHTSLSVNAIDKAIEYRNRSFEIIDKHKITTGEDLASALGISCLIGFDTNNNNDAYDCALKSLNIYNAMPHKSDKEVYAYVNMGSAFLNLNKPELAIKYFSKAKELDASLWGDNNIKSVAHLQRMAGALISLNRLQEAKDCITEALEKGHKIVKVKNLVIVGLYYQRARLNWAFGIQAEAINDLELAAKYARDLGDEGREGLSKILTNLGLYCTIADKPDFDKADKSLQNAVDIIFDIYHQEHFDLVRVYLRLACLFLAKAKAEPQEGKIAECRAKGLEYTAKARVVFKHTYKKGNYQYLPEIEETEVFLQAL